METLIVVVVVVVVSDWVGELRIVVYGLVSFEWVIFGTISFCPSLA